MTTKKQSKVKQIKSIQDLMPDDNNLNKGTERGRYMLEKSLEQNGAGRSILIDRNGKVIAGNKTLEVAEEMGIDEIVVIPSDGKKLVVVQRTDLSMDDPDDKRARVLAYADNRVAQVDLAWDAEKIITLSQTEDISSFIKQDELKELLALTDNDPPTFSPVGADTQGRLDKKKLITCPSCGTEITDY